MNHEFEEGASRVKVLFALLADAANQTADGKLNLLGAFSEVGAPAFPAVRPMAYIVIRIELSAPEIGKRYNIDFVHLDADGAIISQFGGEFDVNVREGKQMTLNSFVDIITPTQIFMPKPGLYSYSIMLQGEEKGRIPFTVIEGAQP